MSTAAPASIYSPGLEDVITRKSAISTLHRTGDHDGMYHYGKFKQFCTLYV